MEKVIFQVLGGLGMFIFGMKIMSEGLQKVAGKKMRQILKMVSDNRFVGCGVGAIVTSIIQSSSATTVMLVGFVDASLMTLTQAVGITIGANIGTTITAQLIAFKITAYALPAIAVGTLLKFFIGRRKWKYIGDVLLGFGFVFYGLATIFMAATIEGGKAGTWVRWLLVVGGALSILHVFGIMAANSLMIDSGYFAAGVLLPLTTALLAVRYRTN